MKTPEHIVNRASNQGFANSGKKRETGPDEGKSKSRFDDDEDDFELDDFSELDDDFDFDEEDDEDY